MTVELASHLLDMVAKDVKINQATVKEVIGLLTEGNTVPFIARYRKEQTGGLDEVEIKAIEDRYQYITQLEERKEEVLRLIDEQDKLTKELADEIKRATQLQRLEDLYRPYKQKRRTKATVAKEKGLEPLAEAILNQTLSDLNQAAHAYINEEHELLTVEDCLAGANDIIAEWISDEASYRERIRKLTLTDGKIETAIKDETIDEKKVYEMYYAFEEKIKTLVSHRVLAFNRAEKEGVIRVSVSAPVDRIETDLKRQVIQRKTTPDVAFFLETAISDSYKRLMAPSIEREIRSILTEEAEEQAIDIFGKNLNNLLLQPPLKGRTILGVDPAFRTGCKLAVIDETGKMLKVGVIYPTAPRKDVSGATKTVLDYIKQFDVDLVAIGNGTASRETEQFIADVINDSELDLPYLIVNEAGASVYSASKLAREEFPDLQVEERSAVSIARRVSDPLAELVKIDPKSIGVGQYQHDVSQKRLNEALTFVVETAVNKVGVNVNTASESLLQYVSGLSKTVAKNIVNYRNEVGKFNSRTELKKIPRLGQKTYEQSIGFLRILDGKEPLDRTPIHPESYKETKALLKQMGYTTKDLAKDTLIKDLDVLDIKQTAETLSIGELTLQDIIKALKSPERDPRDAFPQPLLKKSILSMEDLTPGLELEGTVRNVIDFGVFVDIGVKQDGLVHISKMANRFVKHPMDICSVGDVVTVWVDSVDTQKGRIALTMIQPDQQVKE